MKAGILTRGDKWLIGILLLMSCSGIVFNFIHFSTQTATKAEIRVDGNLLKIIPLRPGYREDIRIGGEKEYAIIEAQDGRIRIRQDDSPRQIGVQTGWVSHPPQQVVNLPYRIVITVISDEKSDLDVIAH